MTSINVSSSTQAVAPEAMSQRRQSARAGKKRKVDKPIKKHVSLRMNLLRAHGDFSLAYTTVVHHGLSYFGDENGFIAHAVNQKKHILALGDPIVAPQDKEQLIQNFVAEHRRAAFCQVSHGTAKILERCGFYINQMGVESTISLPDYTFRGQKKRWLRIAEAWTTGRGYTAREATTESVGEEQIKAVSLAWRASRYVKHREIRFLSRPLVVKDEPHTRRFYFFDPDDRMLAFVFLDPIFRDSQLIGYAASSKRRHPDAPVYAEQAIMKHAIEVFQSEGLQELRFGLSPLAWIEDNEFRSSWLLGKLFRTGFSSRLINKRVYNLQGHAQYKRRYRGQEDKVYFATRSPLNLLQLAAVVKTCKLF